MYIAKIKELTEANSNFRQVLHTGVHSQVVAMSLAGHEDIGLETHDTTDQILFFVSGKGLVVVENDTTAVAANDVVFVPAGAEHNVLNTESVPLKLFTVYAPPVHADGATHATKAEAERAEGHADNG